MRVTTLIPDLQYQMQQSQQALAEATEQLSTGLRVNQVSDDPAASAQMVAVLAQFANIDQYTKNASTVSSSLHTADSAISSIVSSLTSAISLGTAGANGTNSAANRQEDAVQVAGILSSIVSQANTAFRGTYIFGGSASTFPPVVSAATTFTSTGSIPLSPSTALTAGSVIMITDALTGKTMTFTAVAGDTITTLEAAVASAASGGILSAGTTASVNSTGQFQISTNDPNAGIAVSTNDPSLGGMAAVSGTEVADSYVYVGNDSVNKVQVGDHLSVAANLPGSHFLTGASSILSALSSLISALRNGSTDDIGNAVRGITKALNNVNQVRVPIGNTMNILNSQDSFLSQETVSLTSQKNSLVGISIADAATNLSNAELENNTVLAAAAKAIPATLLQYLSRA